MSSTLRLLCEGSSIRGVQKIVKSKAPFTRILWTLFVVGMTLVLLATSGFLISDYLAFDTGWHTTTAFDYKPAFPSFTLCSHQPFGDAAEAAWRSGAVLSPPEFQQQLRNVSTMAILNGLGEPMEGLFAYDNVNTYYQQLNYTDAVAIGHSLSSLFLCMVSVDGMQVLAENCRADDEFARISVRLFPHSEFFNCFTVDASAARGIESVVVVISLTPAKELPSLRHSFVYDVLSRGEGVKVVLHEAGTAPDLAQSGFNAEPGRLNEVNYGTTGWRKLRTPRHNCRDDRPPVRHLGVDYAADYHHCVNQLMQRHMLQRCGCLNSLWPVPLAPGKSSSQESAAPYCIDLGRPGLTDRLTCAAGVLMQAEQLRKNFSDDCHPRCTYFTYEPTLSATHWTPLPSKLAALADQYKAQLAREKDPKMSSDRLLAALSRPISQYQPGEFGSRLARQAAYACVKIRRKNWDINWKLEKLTLDVNILLSRIGGLCSLCIGLTAAFIVELVEFVYLNLANLVGQSPASNQTPTSSHAQPPPSLPDAPAPGKPCEDEEEKVIRDSMLPQAGDDPWKKGLCCQEFGNNAEDSDKRV